MEKISSMNKAEAKITPKIMKWFLAVSPKSAPGEIKHTHGKDTFKMVELSIHQRDWLHSCSSKYGCRWKIPDANMGHNPFDFFMYKDAAACVIIVYPKEAIAIHIKKYLKIKTPSLHIDEAKRLSLFIVKLSDL